MLRECLTSIRAIVALTVLTCLAYPLVVTGIARVIFPSQAAGSPVLKDGRLIGSSLLAQKFTSPRYFWPRPSAGDFATVPSGASNLSFTSQKLADTIKARRQALGPGAPDDLLTASGSGLDPHISPAAATFQVARIAAARHLDPALITNLVARSIEPPQFGFLGEPRVNVLLINLALDRL